MKTIEEFRASFAGIAEHEKKHRKTQEPCICCGLHWYNNVGRDGRTYCEICLGREHDEV